MKIFKERERFWIHTDINNKILKAWCFDYFQVYMTYDIVTVLLQVCIDIQLLDYLYAGVLYQVIEIATMLLGLIPSQSRQVQRLTLEFFFPNRALTFANHL